MSYYQEGYDKGYADGLAGKPARLWFLDFLFAGLTDEDTQKYESGYDAGHAAGAQERRENGDEDE